MSSNPLFPCCQSSVAGTSCFGIRSHARRYSDLMIPSSLKSLARMHCGDLAHQRRIPSKSGRSGALIPLNHTKTVLDSFKALKVRAGIPGSNKRRP